MSRPVTYFLKENSAVGDKFQREGRKSPRLKLTFYMKVLLEILNSFLQKFTIYPNLTINNNPVGTIPLQGIVVWEFNFLAYGYAVQYRFYILMVYKVIHVIKFS